MDITAINKSLQALAAMSNHYGADPEFVLAGGGNTSFKTENNLWIKGSGTSLATIKAQDFVVMDRKKLAAMWTATYPENEAARESAVLADMMNARVDGETRRPSVETLLHDLFPHQYILHVHPAIVNGITCSKEGEAAMRRLFPDAVWVPACKPGYILALDCKERMDAYKAETGRDCDLLFLQNHGIFFAANTVEEIDVIAHHTMDTLRAAITKPVVVGPADPEWTREDEKKLQAVSVQLRTIYGENTVVGFMWNNLVQAYDPATKSLSPDHIVYAKAKQLAVDDSTDLAAAIAAFEAENGYKPKIIFYKDLAMFACADSDRNTNTAAQVMFDAIKVTAYAESFGGVQPMPEFLIDFIVNWEVESYRSKVSLSK